MNTDELDKDFSSTGQNRWITVEAPAKLNLYLKVKRKRQDGYHEIESLMQKIELVDHLYLRGREKGIRLVCPDISLPENEDNLAFQAAEAFLTKAGISSHSHNFAGVDIVLEKKIPIAAGLGGGSSDAAAVLRGMNVLFDAGLSMQQMLTLAKPLGADVPFFATDYSAAWATGIGDNLEPSEPLDDYWIVVVNPGFPVSTKWVYENFALTTLGNAFILARNPETEENELSRGRTMPQGLYNDLEKVTISRFPEIENIKRELLRDGAVGALMSGSGPTVFGLFKDLGSASRSFENQTGRYGENVFSTRFYREKTLSWGVVKR